MALSVAHGMSKTVALLCFCKWPTDLQVNLLVMMNIRPTKKTKKKRGKGVESGRLGKMVKQVNPKCQPVIGQ
jgi:hypothetical protein